MLSYVAYRKVARYTSVFLTLSLPKWP